MKNKHKPASLPASLDVVPMRWHAVAKSAVSIQRLVALMGPPGVGKTTFARQLAREQTGSEPIILAGGTNIEQHHFYGREALRSGDTQWCDGPLMAALKQNRWLLIEDMDQIQFDARSPLLSLESSAVELTNPENNCETVQIPESFRVVATMNPESTRCSHRSAEARALYSRFIIVECQKPSNQLMKQILEHRFPQVERRVISRTIKLYEKFGEIRNRTDDSAGEEILTLRSCENFIKLFALAGLDEPSAVSAAFVTQFAVDDDLYKSAQLQNFIA